jgi:hypothetical protein
MSDKLRPSRRELITAGLVVFLVTALVWTVIDGAGANALTISGVITRQNAVCASLTAVSVVMLIGAWLFGWWHSKTIKFGVIDGASLC